MTQYNSLEDYNWLFDKNIYYAVIYQWPRTKKAPLQGLKGYLGNKVFCLNAIWLCLFLKQALSLYSSSPYFCQMLWCSDYCQFLH